ncbi:MAG: DNA-binding protein [Calditrichaeota bacterium]|nr:MAG: DNA-binding protein [Calditrichota bacterium]
MGENSRFMTPREVEQKYGIARQTLANWRAAGRGPAYIKVSRRKVLYPVSELNKWLIERMVIPGRVA